MTTAIDFTTSDGGLKWGDDYGVSRGFSLKTKKSASDGSVVSASIHSPNGVKVATLQLEGEDWPSHTLDGSASTSYQDFQDLLTAAGFVI